MHLVRYRAHEFGVRGIDKEALWFDLAAAMARKDKIVQGIIDGIYDWVNKSDQITFIRGRAEFTLPVDIRRGRPFHHRRQNDHRRRFAHGQRTYSRPERDRLSGVLGVKGQFCTARDPTRGRNFY